MVEIYFKSIPTDEELRKFYAGRKWRKFRRLALKRDNFECQRCKKLGLVVKAECVHHKLEIKKRPELALDINNLISLCNTCHNIVHPEKLHNINKEKKINIEERW